MKMENPIQTKLNQIKSNNYHVTKFNYIWIEM